MNSDKWLDHFNKQVVAAYSGQTAIVRVGETELSCVIASTHDDRVRGLAEHTELPGDGMLFVYDGDHNARFQRSSMAFDIGIWFFDADGQLVGSGWSGEHSVPTDAPYRYVVETHADLTLKGQLKVKSLTEVA